MTEDQGRKRSATSRRWECAFPQPATDMVDSRVDEMWKATFKVRTPFGDLRNQFRRQHCRTLNPYGSESCPYDRDICALAFMDAVRVTCDARPRVPVGYFRKVAKTMGAIRADNKPLARNRGRMIVLGTASRTESEKKDGPAGAVNTTERATQAGPDLLIENDRQRGADRTAESVELDGPAARIGIESVNGAAPRPERVRDNGPGSRSGNERGIGAERSDEGEHVNGPDSRSESESVVGAAGTTESDGYTGPDADQRGGPRGGLEEGSGEVHRPRSGPVPIGDVFGSLGILPPQGPRQTDAGEEGTE